MSHLFLLIGQKPLGGFDLPAAIATSKKDYFAIGKFIKGGGNGAVFSATEFKDGSLRRTCAIKFLKRLDEQRLDRFANEIRIMRMLKHDNIAEHFDSGTINLGGYRVPWVAQEVGSFNLRETVERFGPLSPQLLKSVALQMCDAIGHLHTHEFIHRDIKPDNFVWVEGSKSKILLIDFGIAKRLHEDVAERPLDQFTRDQEFVGPQQYSSPELIAYAKNKKTPVGRPSDLFQLAKTIWFLATGQVSAGIPSKKLCPFGGTLFTLMMELLSDDPAERLQEIADVRSRIEAL